MNTARRRVHPLQLAVLAVGVKDGFVPPNAPLKGLGDAFVPRLVREQSSCSEGDSSPQPPPGL